MKRAIIYCILYLIGLHLTARGLAQLDGTSHFFLITLLGTTLILPIGSYFILNKEKKGEIVRTRIIKTMILLLVVYLSFLLDNKFNEHTDQVGRDLGKLSLITGISVVGILMIIKPFLKAFSTKKKNKVQQSI